MFYLYYALPQQKCQILDSRRICVNNDSTNDVVKILQNIDLRFNKLIKYLTEKHADHKVTKRLVERYNKKTILSEITSSEHIAYTQDKGDKIAFCLSDKKIDFNTLMYIALHELAHIGTDDVGHTHLFWENFKFILKQAIDIKIYDTVNYDEYPTTFCNMEINNNPLYN